MSSKKTRPPHEVWEALEKESLADEAARVAKLSDAELDAELASHGLDPKALRAKGAALAETLGRAHDEPAESSVTGAWVTAPPPPTPLRPSRRRSVLLLAAAVAVVGLIGGVVAAAILNKPKPPTKDWPDAAPSVTALPPPAPAPPHQEPREAPPKSEDKPKPKPNP
jgi:hypothetical protein